jgi:hypothetical protein
MRVKDPELFFLRETALDLAVSLAWERGPWELDGDGSFSDVAHGDEPGGV